MKKYICPVCKVELVSLKGQVLDLNDGHTLYCGNPNCQAQAVEGHGKLEKDAWEVIQDKFKHILS